MDYTYLEIRKTEKIATVVISRPDSLNALNTKILDELEIAFCELDDNSSVKVIVLTGSGEKSFVAGADIKEMAEMTPFEAEKFSRKGQHLVEIMKNLSKPVIAAVNGYALGGGFELALACDMIFASRNAKFGFPEVTLGIIPGFGGTQNLRRIAGEKIALEMILTGKVIDADSAFELGVVNKTFENIQELVSNVNSLAEKIALMSFYSIKNAREAVINGKDMSYANSLRYESSLFGNLFSTEDQKEGMNAFMQKRKPVFKNR